MDDDNYRKNKYTIHREIHSNFKTIGNRRNGNISDIPWYKDVVEMFEDGLDIHIWLLDNRLRH